jgi:CUG-BP- and ETR3-like factor
MSQQQQQQQPHSPQNSTIGDSCDPVTSTSTPTTPTTTTNSNLYVKNIPQEYTENELKSLFQTYGNVSEVRIMTDKDGISKQIGFVRFEQLQDALESIKNLNGKQLIEDNDAAPLIVKFAETDLQRYERKQRQLVKQQQKHAMYIQPTPLFTPSSYYQMMYPQSDAVLPQQQQHAIDGDESTVANTNGTKTPTDENVTQQKQQTTNSATAGELESGNADYYPPPTIHHHHPSYHHPYNPYQLTDGYPPIQNFVYPPQPLFTPPNSTVNVSSVTTTNGVDEENKDIADLMNTTPQQQNSSTANTTGNTKSIEDANLFVFHLPSDVNDTILYQLFHVFGTIESVKVITDRITGESRGYGFVKYYYMESALQAISHMNGYRLGRKQLKVSFKTANAPVLVSAAEQEESQEELEIATQDESAPIEETQLAIEDEVSSNK